MQPISRNKITLVLFIGLLFTIFSHSLLQSAETSLNQEMDVEVLRKRVSDLEHQLNKHRTVDINRFEIGASAGIPYLVNPGYYTAKPDSSYAINLGYNLKNWMQLGIEAGSTSFSRESAYGSAYGGTYFYNEYNLITYKTFHITPQIKFQGYVGKYVQPFFTLGLGFYNYQSTEKIQGEYTNPYFNSSYEYQYSMSSNGFSFNNSVGINIGRKKGNFKAVIMLRFEPTYGYILIPSLGFLIAA